MAFRSREWGKYIHDSIPFHFDASSENIQGIYDKLKYLDETGNPLKNVLLVTDPTVYRGSAHDGYFGYNADYKIDGSSAIKFHYIFFKGFITNFFFVSYIDYCLNHKYKPYMQGSIPDSMEQYTFDSITNDWILEKRIAYIHSDSVKFYSNKYQFTPRLASPPAFEACINSDCEAILRSIKKIFDKHQTHYKIILGPIYTQRKTNEKDITTLKNIFGNQNVFDFSGINKYSNNIGNYYDHTHYKTYIGAELLQIIYNKDSI